MLALFVVFSSRFSGNKHITKHMPCHVVSAGGGFWSMQSCSWTVLNLYKQHPQSSMSRPTVQIGRWVWQFAQFPRRSPFWLPIKTTDNLLASKKTHGFVASKTSKCESCIDVKPTSFTEGDEKNGAGLRWLCLRVWLITVVGVLSLGPEGV